MKTTAILTPSYLPDIDGLKRLHESVLRFTDSSTIHHVIVPRRDLKAFQRIGSSRLRLWAEEDFLPRGFIATGGISAVGRRLRIIPRTLNCSAVNLRHPWPPLRGWILQQILKLSAATRLDAEVIVIIDSDVVLIRPLSSGTFCQGNTVRLYERVDAVTAELPRHIRWTRTAYELLGIPWIEETSFPDYVGGIISWDPAIVKACLRRIEDVTGVPWATALSKNLHFSEFILYGTFVRHFGTEQQQSFAASRTLCHSYWSPTPLDELGADAFVAEYDGRDIAVHIQSNSETPPRIINDVLTAIAGSATP